MFYHRQCREVVNAFKEGRITKEDAYMRLWNVEEEAYRRISDAEPDGDITYACSVAFDEINEMKSGKFK